VSAGWLAGRGVYAAAAAAAFDCDSVDKAATAPYISNRHAASASVPVLRTGRRTDAADVLRSTGRREAR